MVCGCVFKSATETYTCTFNILYYVYCIYSLHYLLFTWTENTLNSIVHDVPFIYYG